MIRINDPHGTKLVSQRCRVPFAPGYHSSITRYDRRDLLMGGALFTDFNHASVQIHTASFQPNWLSRGFLWLVFDWAYNHLGVTKTFAVIPETNTKSLQLALGLGYVLEAYVSGVFPDGGMKILSMLREDCRYLRMRQPTLTLESKYGKECADP